MTDESISISGVINKSWDIVQEVREKVESLVSEKNKELAYASKMVSSELIENALKYGSSEDNDKGMRYDLKIHNDEISIAVSNCVRSQADLKNVTTHIDKINKSRNPQELYKKRLHELMENSKQDQTQLGFYRIAYEGKFKLKYIYKDNMITIIASKKF